MFENPYKGELVDEFGPYVAGIPAYLYNSIKAHLGELIKKYGNTFIKDYKLRIQLIENRTKYEISIEPQSSKASKNTFRATYIYDLDGNLLECKTVGTFE